MQSASPLSARRDESLKSFQNINHAEVDSSDKRKLKSLFRLLPLNRGWGFARHIQHHAIDLGALIRDTCADTL